MYTDIYKRGNILDAFAVKINNSSNYHLLSTSTVNYWVEGKQVWFYYSIFIENQREAIIASKQFRIEFQVFDSHIIKSATQYPRTAVSQNLLLYRVSQKKVYI